MSLNGSQFLLMLGALCVFAEEPKPDAIPLGETHYLKLVNNQLRRQLLQKEIEAAVKVLTDEKVLLEAEACADAKLPPSCHVDLNAKTAAAIQEKKTETKK